MDWVKGVNQWPVTHSTSEIINHSTWKFQFPEAHKHQPRITKPESTVGTPLLPTNDFWNDGLTNIITTCVFYYLGSRNYKRQQRNVISYFRRPRPQRMIIKFFSINKIRRWNQFAWRILLLLLFTYYIFYDIPPTWPNAHRMALLTVFFYMKLESHSSIN